MENSDSLYLLFASGKYYFLAPVSWVKKIADGSVQEELQTISLAGKESESIRTGCRYRIHLEGAGTCLGIEADKAVGIRNLEEEQMIPLGPPVINADNRFLRAAVPMKLDGEQIMAYVLEPVYLTGKV